MRLTLRTDFALRVLIQVALNERGLTTINDTASVSCASQATSISAKWCAKPRTGSTSSVALITLATAGFNARAYCAAPCVTQPMLFSSFWTPTPLRI
jgi:hypothetical protein